jgi:NAD(P)H-dependent FMN reductase
MILCPLHAGISGSGRRRSRTRWGWETAQRMLSEAGTTAVERYVLAHDPMNVWYVALK